MSHVARLRADAARADAAFAVLQRCAELKLREVQRRMARIGKDIHGEMGIRGARMSDSIGLALVFAGFMYLCHKWNERVRNV